MPDGDGLRPRRIAQEWRLVEQLADRNPQILAIHGRQAGAHDDCLLELSGTSAWVGPDCEEIARSHRFTLRFPRFFPGQPIEAYLERPVFHPNVDPENGFVCLWTKTQPGDTAMEALRRLQRVLSWRSWNEQADHVMQPAAVEWIALAANRKRVPLPIEALCELEEFRREKDYDSRPGPRRKRLEPL